VAKLRKDNWHVSIVQKRDAIKNNARESKNGSFIASISVIYAMTGLFDFDTNTARKIKPNGKSNALTKPIKPHK
jgi:hypothetical protein